MSALWQRLLNRWAPLDPPYADTSRLDHMDGVS